MSDKMAAKKHTSRYLHMLLGVVVLVAGLFSSLSAARRGEASVEAIVRSRQARDLFARDARGDSISRGYHILIDSAEDAPLATIGAVPFVWMDEKAYGPGAGFLALNAFLGAAAFLYLMALARSLGLHWAIGLALGSVLILNPWSPATPANGNGITGIVLFAAAVAAHLVAWTRAGRLFSIAIAANLLGLAILWDVRFLAAVLAGAGVATGYGARSNPKNVPRGIEAFLLVYLTPIFYIPSVWALFCWLILGDPLAPVFGLSTGFETQLFELIAVGAGLGVALILITRLTRLAPFAIASLFVASVLALWAPHGVARSTVAKADEYAALETFASETLGGRMLLAIGRPGYLLAPRLSASIEGFEHLRRLDPGEIEAKTRGRDVFLALDEQQAAFWRSRLGPDFPWEDRFLEAAGPFGPWRVYRFIKPLKTEDSENG